MAYCFLQHDKKWGKYPFSGGHMDFDGCGPTSCADFIYELNSDITPVEVADYMTSSGAVCEGSGVYWKSIVPTLAHYGIKAEMMNQMSVLGEKDTEVEGKWKELMKTGLYYGILLVGTGNFTIGSGHFISAISLDDEDNVLIYNPGLTRPGRNLHPWNLLSGQIKVFYMIEKPELDVLFKNFRIIDGTGRDAYIGCVGVLKGKLITDGVSPNQRARKVVDGQLENGEHLLLCPGFIDSHSHLDETLCEEPEKYLYSKINQGITTEVCGMCGESMFPINPEKMEAHLDCLSACVDEKSLARLKEFTSCSKYFDFVDSIPKGQNYAFNLGHGTLRSAVMGNDNRRPTEEEMTKMEELLAEAMESGCVGMSTGLVYNPGVYAEKEEIIRLCKAMKPYGGVYSSHIRNEAENIVEAVAEAIEIAETAGVRLVISHHKICGRSNFGLSEKTLELIHEARARGVEVFEDQYPYTATQTNLNAIIPPKYFSVGFDEICSRLSDDAYRQQMKAEISAPDCGYDNPWKNCGGFDNALILTSPVVKDAIGKTVGEYAREKGVEDFDAFFDLIAANKGAGTCAYFSLGDEDNNRVYLDEGTVVGSDCIVMLDDSPVHPRAYGSFVRAICRYHKELGLVTLEEAIRKETGKTAEIWGLKGKGLIENGYDADLLIMDYGKLKDLPDYTNGGRVLCEGIEGVYLAGELVYTDKKLTGNYPGAVIRR